MSLSARMNINITSLNSFYFLFTKATLELLKSDILSPTSNSSKHVNKCMIIHPMAKDILVLAGPVANTTMAHNGQKVEYEIYSFRWFQ